MLPLRPRSLTDTELAELDAAYRVETNAKLKLRMLAILTAAEQGLVSADIARLLRVGDSSVQRWIKRFNAEGIDGLRHKPPPGAPRKTSEAYRERLRQIVRQRPRSLGQPYSLWTLDRLADFLAEETGERVTGETVRLYLKADGIRLSRPQHTITSPDPEYQLKKRRSKTSASASADSLSAASDTRCSTTPTSSTSAGTRRSRQCGARSDSRS